MEENKKADDNPSTQYIKSGNMRNTFEQQQSSPKGAEQMNQSFSNPAPDREDQEDASRYANTSGNDDTGNRA